jgi:regulator of RNase E activity RraA
MNNEYYESLKNGLSSAVICDALDSLGYRNQSPRIALQAFTGINTMAGRCKTTLWADMFDIDTRPYELELQAVDSCQPGDVLIAAAGGSNRSGIWGELLSTAAMNAGCRGVIVHGGVRDIEKMTAMGFPVFASSRNIYDSLNRQRVIDMDVQVEIDTVIIAPGDLVFADTDGIVFVPKNVEEEVIKRAFHKVQDESITRNAIKNGMKATEAYKTYGIL